MKASLSFSATDLDTLARSFVPLQIDLSHRDHGTRVISVHKLHSLELVPDRGVRLVGEADIEWTVLGVRVPARISDLSVLIHVAVNVRRLDFRFEIERGEVKHVPDLIEGTLMARINESLMTKGAKPAFRFARMVEREIKLPSMLGPPRDLLLSDAIGELWIDKEQLTFTVDVDMRAKLAEVGETSIPAEGASIEEIAQPPAHTA